MRCVIVNEAKLKAEAACAHCGKPIRDSYVREIGSGIIYCDFRCYGIAAETSITAPGYRVPAQAARTRSS
jgi:hypothetical protein